MKGMKTRPTPPIPYKLFLIAPRTRIKLRRQIGKVGLRKKPHCFKNVVQIECKAPQCGDQVAASY